MSFVVRIFLIAAIFLPAFAQAAIIFRAAKPSDKRMLNALVKDPSFIDYYGGGRPTDPDQLYISLKKYEGIGGNFIIADRDSEKMLGIGHISEPINHEHKWEITYAIMPVQRGMGFGRVAVQQMLAQIAGRDSKAVVIARVAGLNKISQYILETEGFVSKDDFDRTKHPRRYLHYEYNPTCEKMAVK